MKKKRVVVWVIIIMLSLSPSVYVYAGEYVKGVEKTEVNYAEAMQRAEKTGYITRIRNGKLERRLWSYSRKIWLSDWEVVSSSK